ncbi:MAG: M4 family metallopeptidase, partial [Anaerolineales bacterium]
FSGILIAVCISALVLTGAVSATAQQIGATQFPSAQHEPKRGVNPETGRLSFIGGQQAIQLPGVSDAKGMSPQVRAMDMANVYGREFGLKDPLQELKLLKLKKDANGQHVVRFQQVYRGVPILAGELIVNMNETGDLLSMSGEVSPDLTLDTRPAIQAQAARKAALEEIAQLHNVDERGLLATQAELWIFDESLLTFSTRPLELVWRVEVTAKDAKQPIRELVLVNAQLGNISFHVNQVDLAHSINNFALPGRGISSTAHPSSSLMQPIWAGSRRTYTASGGTTLPGAFLCDETQSLCTSGTDADADAAHQFAADTFLFYNVHHARDSYDDLGGTIISTVHYSLNYRNAFWNGSQMVFGDAMAVDDMVGHELTHGVTQYTSGLIYSYQSGAINESFSDVWGEFIDQTNGSGNDSPSVKWLISEDSALGAMRSMSNPPAYGHPDKMSSPYYYTGSGDSGGVHINSGVNNKAAYLMVQGGSFNGKTITGIGLNKTAALYYETQLHHLTTGANYNDLYYALLQACQNLIGGTHGITQTDCEQVKAAAEAVEMIPAPPTTPNITPTAIPPQANNPLYLSLTGNQMIGGVASADEDILRFDGTTWSLFFDGSDVGVGGSDLFGFSFLDADSLLLSFSTALTVNGISVTPRDVLRFDATSLGSNTAGTFSMYLNGIDVGLDVAAENIDSVSLLPDGSVLISTTGNPIVAGVSGAKDEDVLAFTPASLGDATSGTWAIYFDGSDVGLSETSAEDVDALDVTSNGEIYLSTLGDFSVIGVSGADEDVFVCEPASLGDVTACNYS